MNSFPRNTEAGHRVHSQRLERQAIERRRRRRRLGARFAAGMGLVIALTLAGVLVVGQGSLRPAARALAKSAHHAPATPPPPTQAQLDSQAVDHVLSYTPFVRAGGWQKREIALTFDDGPGPYTPDVVRTLRELHTPGTFFEVGFMGRWFHKGTIDVLRGGNVLGDHTEMHARLTWLGPAGQRGEIVSQTQWLRKAGGQFPRLFRPPYGAFDATTFRVLRSLHMLMVLWSVDTDDYRQPGVGTIVNRALSGARPGAIILMHDAGGLRAQTIAALPLIVHALHRRGYKLVTLPQLLREDPPPPGEPLPRSLAGD
jgi:peptidoglycan/xylan/chitin deacetylase (PgdA/CDA1 family)